MAIINVNNKEVVFPDFKYQKEYWDLVTKKAAQTITEEATYETSLVQETLKDCFQLMCLTLKNEIAAIPRASFFIFCHYIHEDSIDLWEQQLKEEDVPIDLELLAASRRGLKIILEQACDLDLIGCKNFKHEIIENLVDYTIHLEKLLYLCYWTISFSEYVSRSQLFPKSTGLQIINGELNILERQPFPELFKYVYEDIPRHKHNVQISHNLPEFKTILLEEMHLDFDVLAGFTAEHIHHPDYKYCMTKVSPMIDYLSENYGYGKEILERFYNGLTISKKNLLSIEDSILKNQEINRYMTRPILEYYVDGEIWNLVGYNKWPESFTVLSTNGFPFGHFPIEWKDFEPIKKFVNRISHEHDLLLEKPIQEILENHHVKFANNIKSLTNRTGDNVLVDIEGVGEIDLIFIQEDIRVIYVGEAKHNRSRFDMNNWKRDYSNFQNKYEAQLEKKILFVRDNLDSISEHFNAKYDSKIDLSDYEIRGVFFINAPTAYMYDGAYRAFTVTDLTLLVKKEFIDLKFGLTEETTNEYLEVSYPYFKNLAKLLP